VQGFLAPLLAASDATVGNLGAAINSHGWSRYEVTDKLAVAASVVLTGPEMLGVRGMTEFGVESEASVVWNNGWRTADGKFASPLGAGRPGESAEVGVWDAIDAKPGWRVDRGPIAVRDASGQLRYYDGVAISPSGKVIGLEVKSGTGTRTAPQAIFDRTLNSSRSNVATGVGQSVGTTVNRAILIKVP